MFRKVLNIKFGVVLHPSFELFSLIFTILSFQFASWVKEGPRAVFIKPVLN